MNLLHLLVPNPHEAQVVWARFVDLHHGTADKFARGFSLASIRPT
jgi:hypothetical protein